MLRLNRRMARRVATIIVLAYASGASAQNYSPGDRVEASPLFMDSAWEDCEIVAPVDGNSYKVACGPSRYQYSVTTKWIRAAAPKPEAPRNGGNSPAKPAPVASANQGEGLCTLGTRVVDREGKTGTVIEGGKGSCHVRLDDGSDDRGYYLVWLLSPAGKDGNRPSAGKGELEEGRYSCSAAAGIAGTFKLTISSSTQYANSSGKTGRYGIDGSTGKIVFQSGPFEGQFGKKLGPGKFGISSDEDGFFATTCNLE